MKNLFRELYSQNEVAGLFISDGEHLGFQRVKQELMPVDSHCVLSAFAALKYQEFVKKDSGSEIVVSYKEAVLIFTHLKEKQWLQVVCLAGANSDRILKHVRDAVEQMNTGNSDQDQAECSERELPEGSEAVLKVLISVVGPMAEILFRDAESSWKSGKSSGQDPLEEFTRYIKNEIDDSKLAEMFESGLEHVLSTV